MQGKFVCILAIFAIVAAMTFSEADGCRHCGYDSCGGCADANVIAVAVPAPQPSCHGCGGHYSGASCLPRRYCNSCLRRKSYRLANHCGCGCDC